MSLPWTLKNFNLHIQGVGYAGKITTFQPPKIDVKTAEHRGGGLDTPVMIDMGLNPLTASWTMAEWSGAVQNLAGVTGDNTFVIAYGAISDDSSATAVKPVKYIMKGQITSSDPGTWQAGNKTQHKYNMKLRFLNIVGYGAVILIDVVNNIRMIGTADQVEAIRNAIKQ